VCGEEMPGKPANGDVSNSYGATLDRNPS